MRVETMDAARLQRIFATNVVGSFLCAREAVRRMSTRHGGPRRRHRQRVVGGRAARRAGRIRRLRRVQGRDRHVHDRPGAGSGAQKASASTRVRAGFIYTEMHASGGEPDRVDRVEGVRADAARRRARGSRARDPVAAVGRGLVLDRRVHRRLGRAVTLARASRSRQPAALEPSYSDRSACDTLVRAARDAGSSEATTAASASSAAAMAVGRGPGVGRRR